MKFHCLVFYNVFFYTASCVSYLIYYQTYIQYSSKIALFIKIKLLAQCIHKKALAYEI